MKDARAKGRPKADPQRKFDRRHVVNLSGEMETAVQAFCDANDIARITDGLRSLIAKGLRSEGVK